MFLSNVHDTLKLKILGDLDYINDIRIGSLRRNPRLSDISIYLSPKPFQAQKLGTGSLSDNASWAGQKRNTVL
jgi:hypothetical protein